MPNLCREAYQCNSCCRDVFIEMPMFEFSIFVQAWLAQGYEVIFLGDKKKLRKIGNEFTEKHPQTIVYASKSPLEEFLTTGKHGNILALVVFAGLCANNDATTGDCKIEERKPSPCNRFRFQGHSCNDMRNQPQTSPANFIPLISLQ